MPAGFTLLVLACTTAPLRMPDPLSAVGDEAATRRAILAGMAVRGWLVEDESAGRILARMHRRRHTAKVWIDYGDAHRVSFAYGGSEELGCEPRGDSCSTIHRVYNMWASNLAVDIAREIDEQRAQHPPPE